MGTSLESFRSYAVRLAKWDADVTIVRTEAGATYFTVRQLCKAIGISPTTQTEILRADDRFAEALREFRLVTAGGPQDVLCLRKREAAWWLANINPRRVAEQVRGRLEEFQADLMAAADRLAWGDLSDMAESARRAVTRPPRGELYCDCPQCGAPLRIVIEATGAAYVQVAE